MTVANVKRLVRRAMGALPKAASTSHVDFLQTYPNWVKKMVGQSANYDEAMALAVGGEYHVFGAVQRKVLESAGLLPEHKLVDIGCGSGRLPYALRGWLKGGYAGYDVVDELVHYARAKCPVEGWRFEVVREIRIPEASDSADMVCFFSVLTHLLHEQSYAYLQEAKRVLKPGGRLVFSFLEFRVDKHWKIFEPMVARGGKEDHPLNMFIGRDGIAAWAEHLDMAIERLHDGDQPIVEFAEPLPLEDGKVLQGQHVLGQSLCVLVKK